jgi:hypothetical protein
MKEAATLEGNRMESTSNLFFHPLIFLLFFSCFATLLATIAWGRPGAINSLLIAPFWGAALATLNVVLRKPPDVTWSHVNLLTVSEVFLGGTATWLVAAIPGTLMGLAVGALIRKFSARSSEPTT